MNDYADRPHAEKAYHAGLASNAAQQRYAGAQNATPAPRPPTAIGQLSTAVEQHNEGISSVVHRLENLIERLAGPQPCDPGVGKVDAPPPSHAIARIESHLRSQASLIARLNAASNVLDNLA